MTSKFFDIKNWHCSIMITSYTISIPLLKDKFWASVILVASIFQFIDEFWKHLKWFILYEEEDHVFRPSMTW